MCLLSNEGRSNFLPQTSQGSHVLSRLRLTVPRAGVSSLSPAGNVGEAPCRKSGWTSWDSGGIPYPIVSALLIIKSWYHLGI